MGIWMEYGNMDGIWECFVILVDHNKSCLRDVENMSPE